MKRLLVAFLPVAGLLQPAPAAGWLSPPTAHEISSILEDSARVAVPGSVHPLARSEFDLGRADPDLPMERMILSLKVRPGAQARLEHFLAEQQNPSSPNYRRWLTPEQFGENFGITPAELESIAKWLREQGFRIDDMAKGRTWISFSATARQVEAAFQTQIHEYLVGGEIHHANSEPVRLPSWLASVSNGVVSLHDFRANPSHLKPLESRPASALYTDPSGNHYLVPADFWIIYDAIPILQAGITGNGIGIAIAGRTDINLNDVRSFRLLCGLPANDPVIFHNGSTPGNLGGDEELEANIDVQWSGAIAPESTVGLVVSASTMTPGEILSAMYVVNNNLAPILSYSFGLCEAALGVSGNTLFASLWAQAAAQGISVIVASGDSGAAGCDSPTESTALNPPGVSGICSTPFDTCVGGTQFQNVSDPSLYWAASNDPTFLSSALSYIPELPWDESGLVSGGRDLHAAGGGRSLVYAKPDWQDAPGVPADGSRDTPDLSLFAAGFSPSNNGYRLFLRGSSQVVVYGTSVAAPAFAGIMALVLQETGIRQGNINPVLYQFAQNQYGGSGSTVFHDVTTGDNSVPGETGYTCGTGYDLATGLGSVDVSILAADWPTSVTPAASFDFAPANPIAGQVVSFTDTSTGLPNNWSWNFGDPASGELNTSVLQNPTHTFAQAATYTVTLVASNTAGQSQSAIAVTVNPEQPRCYGCTTIVPFRSRL